MIRQLPAIDDLVSEARAAHRIGAPVDWKVYETLKRRLQQIVPPGSSQYESAIRRIADGLEGRG